MTWVSVSSDIPTLANFLPHLHSAEQRQESMTVDMDSDKDSDNFMVMYSTCILLYIGTVSNFEKLQKKNILQNLFHGLS